MRKGVRCWLRLHLRFLFGGWSPEVCRRCGADVGLVWSAPNEMWNALVGSPNGIICVKCFDRLARTFGIILRWRPEVL